MKAPVSSVKVVKFIGEKHSEESDLIVQEEPLEIRLKYFKGASLNEKRLAVTMRTPGNDFELCIGFLISEGIIASYSDVQKIFYCEAIKSEEERDNVIIVQLNDQVNLNEGIFNRNFYVSSSCGVCGKSSIESVTANCQVHWSKTLPKISGTLIHQIPKISIENQQIFKHTGGLHASVLFNSEGKHLITREDIGRHNALDKVIGARAIEAQDNSESILFVSGRSGFELVQKSIMAGIPIMISVGAPSSLSVNLAVEHDLTLIGFARNNKFNVYSGRRRIKE